MGGPWMGSTIDNPQPPLPGGGFIPGGDPLPSGRRSSLGRNQFAVNRAAPGRGGMSSLLSQHTQTILAGMSAPGGPLGRPGALDMDQWQMGRTASIHVHNEHPSIRMEIAGMG
jgi:hypothetical protein